MRLASAAAASAPSSAPLSWGHAPQPCWARCASVAARTCAKGSTGFFCAIEYVELRSGGIVRALARDGDVMHVALAHAGTRDAHELGLVVQLGESAGADIAHGGAQAAGELVQHG